MATKTVGTVALDAEQVDKFKDQVLLVLADYQTTRDAHAFGRQEGVRLEVAKRIIDNLRACSSPAATPKNGRKAVTRRA